MGMIHRAMEECWLDQQDVDDQVRWMLNQAFTAEQWVQLSETFLKGISKQHKIPGNTIFKIADIGNQFRQTKQITSTQSMFLSNTMLDNWDQMSCESRALLPI